MFFLIKDIKGKIMLNIDSLGFIKNERNAPGDLLEKLLTPSKVESDF